MKTLLILRHAKSSWKDEQLADHERPLNKRGLRTAPQVGWLLREEDLVPDLILCSSALRAVKTAQLVSEACGYSGETLYRAEFYDPGDPPAYIEALRKVPAEYGRVMVVGHNPGLEELLSTLTGEDLALPTAALAQVVLPILGWRELTEATEGQLANFFKPPREK